MKWLIRVFVSWIPLGIAITLICGLVYATLQQNYRQSLNDPQIQVAEDAAQALASGARPEQIVPDPAAIDMVSSLAPWVAIYSATGTPMISSGVLNNDMPQLPEGVLESARTSTGKDTDQPNEDRVTWQSGAGVRQAVVVVYFDSVNGQGFVAAGRNMREGEDREAALTLMVGLGWLVTLVVTFCAQGIVAYLLGQ